MSKNNFSVRLLSITEEDFTEIISFIAAIPSLFAILFLTQFCSQYRQLK